MKEIELTDLEAWTLLGGTKNIIARNIQAEKGMGYDLLRKFLTVQKAFEPLAEALEKAPTTTLGELKAKTNTYDLPTFEKREWESLVRGEEAFVLEKLVEDAK